jgi:hypothetical protein
MCTRVFRFSKWLSYLQFCDFSKNKSFKTHPGLNWQLKLAAIYPNFSSRHPRSQGKWLAFLWTTNRLCKRFLSPTWLKMKTGE